MEQDIMAAVKWADLCPCCREPNIYKVGEECTLLGPGGVPMKARNTVFDAAEVVFEFLDGPYKGKKIHYLRQAVN